MIVLILKIIFLTVCWSLGWRIIVSDGMLFEKIGQWAEKKVEAGNKFYDIFVCPWCIPNAHAILFVWPLIFGLEILPFEWNWKYLFMYPFCLGASSFITGVLWTFYTSINSKKQYHDLGAKYFENAQEYYYHSVKNIKKQNGKSS